MAEVPAPTDPDKGVIHGASPFVGMDRRHMADAAGRWVASVARHPLVASAEVLSWAAEEARVLAGTSAVAPDPKDKRFASAEWHNPLWRRVASAYLVSERSLVGSADKFGLDQKSASRARFALGQVMAAAAPTNQLLGNPVAMKKAARTRGRSLIDGGRHFFHDVRHNGGLPSQVDTRPFRTGETIAVTPGQVIHRSDTFELIQYGPATPKVATVPTLILPPQINRYYFLDLAPGRSLVEYALSRGLQVFMVSWRNPGPAQRGWGLDHYVESSIEAMEVAADIAGTDTVNVAGFCSGGMTELAVLSHLAAVGRDLIASATLAVTLADTAVESSLDGFVTSRTLKAGLSRANRKGILEGRDMARLFAWARPNDLVWNYVVSNYLMGENPPPFDVLAWNADATNMPAGLYADFMKVRANNALCRAGAMSVLGHPLDLATAKQDNYVVGALTDHLVPWQSAYAVTQFLGGHSRFVLSNSGHIQALVNPPGNPKANFFENDALAADPEQWLSEATKRAGSWWVDWADWVLVRSGEERTRPRRLGNSQYKPITPAPGEYVRS